MSETVDVAVVGGGPAGAVAALCLARRGRKVCLLESGVREPAGETLPPEINRLLRALELTERFHALAPMESPGIVSVWNGSAYEQDFVRNPQGPGWHVDRPAFDRMLCAAAEEAGAIRGGGGDARLVIDATGCDGGERLLDDRLVALVLRAETRGVDQRTYVEATPAGWWYSAPSRAMFFTDPDLYAEEGIVPEEQLAAAPWTRERLRDVAVLDVRVMSVPSSCRRTIVDRAWLAAGDSASAYDPLSGRGIYKALRHGRAAAAAADRWLDGDEKALGLYESMVRDEFDSYCRQRRAYYAAETRWSALPFWRNRRR